MGTNNNRVQTNLVNQRSAGLNASGKNSGFRSLGVLAVYKSLISKSRRGWIARKGGFTSLLTICIFAMINPVLAESFSRRSTSLDTVRLPSDVKEALELNHEIGRDEWDSMSIDSLRVFDIIPAGKSVSTQNVLEALIQMSLRSGNPALQTLSKHCQKSKKRRSRLNTQDCAKRIIKSVRRNPTQSARKFFSKLNRWTQVSSFEVPEEDLEMEFRESIETLKDYILDTTGSKVPFSLLLKGSRWSVDIGLLILISTKEKKVLLVSYNEGA